MICQRCILPENYPGIHFDETGVCNVCRYYEKKWEQKDYQKSEKQLQQIIDHYRGKNKKYDCIVPLSGAKDSTYVLYYLKKKYDLRILAVNHKNGFQTPQALENMENACKILDVDFVSFMPRWEVLRKAYATCFRRTGEFCIPCNQGTFATVYHASEDNQTPLVVMGYTAQFEISPIWSGTRFCREKLFKEVVKGEISDEDLGWFLIDPLKRRTPVHVISLFSYVNWEPNIIFPTLRNELKWREGPYGWDKVDCKFLPIAKYFRRKRSGFSRETITNAAAVRIGLMSREEALRKTQEEESHTEEPPMMGEWLDTLGLTRDDLNGFEKRSRLDFVNRIVTDEDYENLRNLNGKYKPEEVIEKVLETVRPEFHRDGGDIEFNGIEGGIAYVTFKGDCKWCYMSPAVDINYLEGIILPIVPEIKGIEVATEFAD